MRIRLKLMTRMLSTRRDIELDRQTFEVSDEPFKRAAEIGSALECWVLSPGDTIKIEEV